MAAGHFSPQLFGFLRELAANNDRTWFKEHQDRYDGQVREPALRFIDDFTKPLHRISPHFEADSRTVGGSLMRVHRDIRFSKDKTPYKTNVGIQFRHEQAGDVHAPAFYLHLAPRESFVGAGMWRPHTQAAYAIRHHIDGEPTAWKRATRSKRFSERFTFGGDSLVRPPKGFDATHPLLEDLKRKDFIASTPLTQRQVTAPDFLKDFTDLCRRATPLVRFLCEAQSLPF